MEKITLYHAINADALQHLLITRQIATHKGRPLFLADTEKDALYYFYSRYPSVDKIAIVKITLDHNKNDKTMTRVLKGYVVGAYDDFSCDLPEYNEIKIIKK